MMEGRVKFILPACLLVVTVHAAAVTAVNKKPIIGILTQDMSEGMMEALAGLGYKWYIASSYVKYFESGGARVVPILVEQDEVYYRKIVSSVNGIVFPGGGSSIRSGPYADAGRTLYNLVLEKAEQGNEIAMIGICLGFQMLMYLAAVSNPLTSCNAKDVADPLFFKPGLENSQIFGEAPDTIIKTLAQSNSTSNFHAYCVTETKFMEKNVNESFKIISTSFDKDGVEYISTVEHKTLPIYGLQWHPEKNLFEWVYGSIPHTMEAVGAAQYVVNVFVEKARQNNQKFSDVNEEAEMLIYNYDSIYIRRLIISSFMECYFFKDEKEGDSYAP
ncbi:gamma-glutamyl hydrolase-like [Macrobrachium rosenbergii]|uniref:gamma-glutamyl hydrolase-like n=1 Tax=Macrobrachium rosenbergii TaxID=79674 RepID=UPI0034D41BD1